MIKKPLVASEQLPGLTLSKRFFLLPSSFQPLVCILSSRSHPSQLHKLCSKCISLLIKTDRHAHNIQQFWEWIRLWIFSELTFKFSHKSWLTYCCFWKILLRRYTDVFQAYRFFYQVAELTEMLCCIVMSIHCKIWTLVYLLHIFFLKTLKLQKKSANLHENH